MASQKNTRVPGTELSALPPQVAEGLAEAEHIQKRMAEQRRISQKSGPVPKSKYKKGAIFVADSEVTIDELIEGLVKAVGSKKPGNKRRGRTALYGDLVRQFTLLKEHGVNLPRGGSLSLAACQHGLGAILREHGYMSKDKTDIALKNSRFRDELGHKLARIFDRVANAIENPPA